jgi:hypothetical protein
MDFRRFLVLFALLPYWLVPQENSGESASYAVDYSSGTPRFTQRLSWYPEEYASFYGVFIEEALPSGTYRELLRTTATESHLDVSLPPGLYRYRIQSYDLFEKPAGDPPWILLEILPALQPELLAVKPDTPEKNANTFSVSFRGRNIAEGARIILKNRNTGGEQEGVLYAGPDGNSGHAVFSSFPETENCDLVIVNPGGLQNSVELLFPAAKRNYCVSAGYKPLFFLYGELNEMLDSKLQPLGFGARFWSLPFRPGNFELGFGAAADYVFFSSGYSPGKFDYRVTGHFAGLFLRAVIQKQFSKRLSVQLQAGGGIAAAFDFKKQSPHFNTEAVTALFPAAGAGLSVSFLFSDSWFALLGLEYLHLFSADKADPAYLSPYIGIGVKR